MDKKSKAVSGSSTRLAFFSPASDMQQPAARADEREGWPLKPQGPAVATIRTQLPLLDDRRGKDLQTLFLAIKTSVFSVREIAACFDRESRRLSLLYQRLVLQGDPEGRCGGDGMDSLVVAPLIGHLARGVQVGDIHKILNVAREPLFDGISKVRGRRTPHFFSHERAVALYVLWRLGHSFHLVPAIRRSIARQLTAELVRKIAYGREYGLAVTPFVAAIGDLEELLAANYAEVVAFSLNGLVAHALLALDEIGPTRQS